jgi:hypothetical protein
MKRPHIRITRFDDYDQIAHLQQTNGLVPKQRDQWLHLWKSNPAYKKLANVPIGWVLEDGEAIVGSVGNIPFLYHLRGREYVAAGPNGWVVDPGYRAWSCTLLMEYLRQCHVDLLVNTTPNARASAIFEGLGWSRPPVGLWNRTAFWVTNHAHVMSTLTARKAPPRLSAAVARLLYAPLLLGEKICFRSASPKQFRQWGLKWETAFDARFDCFWEQLKEQRRNLVLSVRSKEVLDWHFAYAIKQNRIWILTAVEDDRLIGYAVFEKRKTRFEEISRVLLIDFVCLEPNNKLFSAMMTCAVDRCRREGAHVLENFGCWLEGPNFLNAKAPHHRSLNTSCYLYHAGNHELREALQSQESWHATQYDGDATL